MLHKPDMYDDFKQKARIIRLINKQSEVNDEQTGYDVDLQDHNGNDRNHWLFRPDRPSGARGETTNPVEEAEKMQSGEIYIYTMIVTTKGPATVGAMRSVKHRVDARTTICFMQNGLGQIDELNRQVFTDPATRPAYMLGIVSHGCYMSGRFTVIHAGFGTVALGIYRDPDRYPLPPKSPTPNISDISEDERRRFYPTDKELFSNLSSRYLLRTLTRSPTLVCAAFPYLDLFQLQLEKLSANAILNPLTALLDVPNGGLLYNKELSMVQRLLLAEISLVIRSLPELEGLPNVRKRFSSKRLEHLLLGVTSRTAQNSSSMREDVRFHKHTEIDYINGYIVKRGEEVGIKCVLNFMMLNLVKGKTWLQRSADGAGLPYGVTRIEGEVDPDHPGVVTLDDQGKPAKGNLQ
jgi:2-dehydropantoate 2-reductase